MAIPETDEIRMIDLTINEFDLTEEEIGFIKTRHSSKQLVFALLFKYYQKSHQFISDLTKLPAYLIKQVAGQLNPSDLKQMSDNRRCAHLFMYCHTRKEENIDKTIDMFNRIIRNVIHKSEKCVVKKLVNDVKKVYGKDTMLFHIAEVRLEQPDGTIRDKIFPLVGQDKLRNINDEYRKKEPKYQSLLHQQIRSSYASYSRRMVNPLLEIVVFRSNNSVYQPILKALTIIKKYLQEKWESTSLIDMLKEVDLENRFTHDFISYGEKTYLKSDEISERILLSIYGMGTNVGLKHMCAGNAHISEHQLRHIKNYFLSTDNLKNALGKVFKIRLEAIWGGMPIAVASDSTQFSVYFQNLISEFHNRYGGRGVMIYWHVEKNTCCIHSQLKSVSSSEVSAMIEGVLRHCTEMSVHKSYVDTHGQSEVGFAFSHLLGFSLMPRLANLDKQKLAQCEPGDYQKYRNLQAILTDTINWQLIREQYSEIVKYTAAMKAGHADSESIFRRFNQNNLKHPTYMALSQLGKILKTIFICKYLMHESIRQEIQERLTKEDKRALTLLIYEHVNPYGLFPLDLSTRLPYLEHRMAA